MSASNNTSLILHKNVHIFDVAKKMGPSGKPFVKILTSHGEFNMFDLALMPEEGGVSNIIVRPQEGYPPVVVKITHLRAPAVGSGRPISPPTGPLWAPGFGEMGLPMAVVPRRPSALKKLRGRLAEEPSASSMPPPTLSPPAPAEPDV